MSPRIPLASDAVLPIGLPDTSGLAPALDQLRRRLPLVVDSDHLDAVTAELVRLRNARRQGCNLCQGLRSRAALESGATEELLAEGSELPTASQRAALRVADAFLSDPNALDPAGRDEVLAELTAEQVVEVVERLAGWSYNKVLIALGLDLDEIRPQVY